MGYAATTGVILYWKPDQTFCQSDSQSPTYLDSTQSNSQSLMDLESTQSQNIGNARMKCIYVHEMPIYKSSSGRPVNIIQ